MFLLFKGEKLANVCVCTVAGIAINGFAFLVIMREWLEVHPKYHTHFDPHIPKAKP